MISALGDSRVILHWPTDRQLLDMHTEQAYDDGSLFACLRLPGPPSWVTFPSYGVIYGPTAFSGLPDSDVAILRYSAIPTAFLPAGLRRCERLVECEPNSLDSIYLPAVTFSYPKCQIATIWPRLLRALRKNDGSILRDLQRMRWTVSGVLDCRMDLGDSPRLCWQRSAAWFDSPHQHENRCLGREEAEQLIDTAGSLDAEFYRMSAEQGHACLRYRQSLV